MTRPPPYVICNHFGGPSPPIRDYVIYRRPLVDDDGSGTYTFTLLDITRTQNGRPSPVTFMTHCLSRFPRCSYDDDDDDDNHDDHNCDDDDQWHWNGEDVLVFTLKILFEGVSQRIELADTRSLNDQCQYNHRYFHQHTTCNYYHHQYYHQHHHTNVDDNDDDHPNLDYAALAVQRYIYVCHAAVAKQWCTLARSLSSNHHYQ